MKKNVLLSITSILLISGCKNYIEGWKKHYHPASYVLKSPTYVPADVVRGEEFYLKSESEFQSFVKSKQMLSLSGNAGNLQLGYIPFTSRKILTPGDMRWITGKMGGDYYYYNAFPVPGDPSVYCQGLFIFATQPRQTQLVKLGVLRMTLQDAKQRIQNSQNRQKEISLLLNETTL
jgi:hypothetical protein